jgi:beta-amylase
VGPQNAMAPDLGEGRTITDVCIGCGPCGELRYPSYPENRRALRSSQWLFPGVGEFQCYDHHALTSLRQTAELGGVPQWGTSGPHDAGGYNDWPESTGFFRSEGGSWDRCV